MNEEMVRLLKDIMACPPRVAIEHSYFPEEPVIAALAILDAACRFVQNMDPQQRWLKAQDVTPLADLIRTVLSARIVSS